MADIRSQIGQRLYIVLTLVGIVPLFVFGQLIRLTWVNGEALRQQGIKQAQALDVIPAMRGAILDRNGRTLAVNEARYDLELDALVEVKDKEGKVIASFVQSQRKFINYLAALTGVKEAEFALRIRNASDKHKITIARRLTEDQKQDIEWWGVPGLTFKPSMSRLYNYNTMAAQILGYVGQGRGQIGLEQGYDSVLAGVDGKRPVQKSRPKWDRKTKQWVVRMQPVSGGPVVEPKHGENLHLTLDLGWQTILEEELQKGALGVGATWGTAIAVDPQTGAVLGMANYPSFNPNLPKEGDDMRNHAVQDQIEPGSTFKLVAALAAFDQGKVAFQDGFATGSGRWNFHGQIVTDDHAAGQLNFADIIVRSSNIGIGQVAERVKPGVFYQYARALGFGQPSMIDLPDEAPGRLKRPDRWSRITQNSMSRGYEVDANPLQVLMAYAALANDCKLMQPYVVSERTNSNGAVTWQAKPRLVREVCKPDKAQQLRINAFERAVERPEGTGHPAYIAGLRTAGKTGTARKVVDGRYSDGKYRASFVGLFPADNPQVAMIVVLDEPQANIYGGETAAPIFRNIARRLMGLDPEVATSVARNLNEALPKPKREEMPIPNVRGIPASVAVTKLRAAGFKVESPENPMLFVVNQAPKAGEIVTMGSVVRLDLDKQPIGAAQSMPNVVGLDARQAVNWLVAWGIKTTVQGGGKITKQIPEAGTATPQSAVLVGDR